MIKIPALTTAVTVQLSYITLFQTTLAYIYIYIHEDYLQRTIYLTNMFNIL